VSLFLNVFVWTEPANLSLLRVDIIMKMERNMVCVLTTEREKETGSEDDNTSSRNPSMTLMRKTVYILYFYVCLSTQCLIFSFSHYSDRPLGIQGLQMWRVR